MYKIAKTTFKPRSGMDDTAGNVEIVENTYADKVCRKCRFAFIDPEK